MPAHINAARQIKHVFTGNLNAQIDSNPLFPGKERHYLRAQIARITMSCSLIPKGLLEFNEEEAKEVFAEGFTVPSTEELKSTEVWAHRHPQILQVGRCTHQAPAHMNEEERDEYLTGVAEKDPVAERYMALNEDKPWRQLEPPTAWISRVAGDLQPYNPASGDGGP